MELVDGIDLSRLVGQIGPVPAPEACEIIRQVATGLQHAHEHGLVHRDVKPSNVMLTRDGGVKILDLGLARLHESESKGDELTMEGQTVGTLDYMAPEQLGDCRKVDIRADIYGMGATLYKLLCADAPFAGCEEKAAAILTKSFPPIEDRVAVPEQLAGLLERCMAKAPDQRPATPAAVGEALGPLAAGSDLSSLAADIDAAPATSERVAKGSTYDAVASASADTPCAVAETKPQPGASSRSPWRSSKARWLITAAVALFFVIGALAVYYLTTNVGTLEVRVDDDQVAVIQKNEGLVVHDLKNGRKWIVRVPGDKTLALGDYRLNVTDDAGLNIDTERFSLTRGDREVVRISLALDDQRLTPPKPGEPTKASPLALVTRPAKLNGVRSWSIETVVARGRSRGAVSTPADMSPDGKFLATATHDRVIRIHDLSDGRLLHAWPVHSDPSYYLDGLDWSQDMQFLASVGGRWGDNEVNIWRFPTGKQAACLELDFVASVAWSPQRTLLAAARRSQLVLWSPEERQRTVTIPGVAKIHPLKWSPSGDLLALGCSDAKIRIWHFEEEKFVCTLDLITEQESHPPILELAWSPDGTRLLSGSPDRKVRLWNPLTGAMLRSVDQPRPHTYCYGIGWSPDGEAIALFHVDEEGENAIGLWDPGVGVTRSVQLHAQSVGSLPLGWSRDGHTLAGVVQGGAVRAYDMPVGRLRFALDEIKSRMASWTPGGDITFWIKPRDSDWGYPSFLIWSLEIGEKLRSRSEVFALDTPPFSDVLWSPRGRYLATWFANQVSVFQDGVLGREVNLKSDVVRLAWASDCQRLAICTDKSIHVWEPLTGRMATQIDSPPGGVGAVAWAPASLLAIVGQDGQVRIWDVAKPKLMATAVRSDHMPASLLAFSPDGTLLASVISSRGGTVEVWQSSNGEPVQTLKVGPPICALRWSSESLVCTSNDGTSRAWNPRSDLVPSVLPKTSVAGNFIHASLSPDGRLLASRYYNSASTWLFKVTSGTCLGAITATRNGQIMQISPEGHYMASADVKNDIVYVVELDSGERLTLRQDEFESRFQWKNDPDRARITVD
jgi:WD40 repeat protein